MLVDVNVWLGSWPFQKFAVDAPVKLVRHLDAEGISDALVSSPESILLPDPDQGNKVLLSRLRKHPHLHPVMIVNPSLGNWKELLRKYADLNIGSVKLLPNFHCYSLSSRFVHEMMEGLARHNMLPIIQVRVEDERAQYPLCKVPGVEVKDIVELACRFSSAQIIVSCAYFREATTLVNETENLYVDIAFVERLNTVSSLLETISAERVLFGSHTPFLYTRSAVMKVEVPDIDERNRKLIMSGNVLRLLDIR